MDRVEELLGLSTGDLQQELRNIEEHEIDVILELVERLDESRRKDIAGALMECLCGGGRRLLMLRPREVLAEAIGMCLPNADMPSFLKELCKVCYAETRKNNAWGNQLSAIPLQ